MHNKNGLNLLFTRKSRELQDFQTNNINHLLNEIVCNRRSSQDDKLQRVQLRRINSAIYAESIKSNSDVSVELTAALSNISIDDKSTFNIYRRTPSILSKKSTSLITTTTLSKSFTRVERRCRIEDDIQPVLNARDQPQIQRCTLSGHKVIHVSTSLSSCAPSSCHDYKETSMLRNRAHVEWIQKKKLEIARRKKAKQILEMCKKINEDELTREKAEHERRERENFSMWIEKKKREDNGKRETIKKERELKERLRAIEAQIVAVKEFHLWQWSRKRGKMQKAQKHDHEIKIKQHEEEKRKRLGASSKAFELWCEKSKNRPRPATQGLLPHQRSIPSYINPIPWVINDTLPKIE